MANRLEGPNTFTGTNTFSGTLVLPSDISGNGKWPVVNMAQRVLSHFQLPLQDARIWDAPQTPLPTTSATDDLGLTIGTFGTSGILIQTSDMKTLTATRYCRWPQVVVPHNYEAGESILVRLFAGMDTTVSDTTATIDVEAYVTDGIGGVSADKCTTAAQDMNTLTDANLDFELGTTLVPGDILDIRVAIAVVDGLGATAVIANIGRAYLVADLQ